MFGFEALEGPAVLDPLTSFYFFNTYHFITGQHLLLLSKTWLLQKLPSLSHRFFISPTPPQYHWTIPITLGQNSTMNPKEFEEMVRLQIGLGGRDLPSDVVEALLDHYRNEERKPLYYQQDVSKFFGLARRMEAVLRARGALKKPKSKSRLPKKLVHEQRSISELVVNALEPEVQLIRRRLFGGPQPPYTKEQIEDSFRNKSVTQSMIAFVRQTPTRYEEEWDYEVSDELPPDLDISIRIPLYPDTLFEFAEKTAGETGFSEDALILFVLTGIKPQTFQLFKVSFQPKTRGIPFGTFSARIFTSHVTWEVMKEIHREIKRQEPKELENPKEATLVSVMDALGGIPNNNKGAFWQEAVNRCRELGIKDWGTPDAARRCYDRLQKRLRQA